MIKQNIYEDIKKKSQRKEKWSWQQKLTQSKPIINHWLHETTFSKLLQHNGVHRGPDQFPFVWQWSQGKSLFLCVCALTAEVTVWVVPSGLRMALRCCLPSGLSSPPAIPGLCRCSSNTSWNKKNKQKKSGRKKKIKHWLARQHW